MCNIEQLFMHVRMIDYIYMVNEWGVRASVK